MFIITALRTRPRVLISPQYVHKHAGTNGGSSVLIDDLFSELGIAVISSLPAQATTRLTNLHPPPTNHGEYRAPRCGGEYRAPGYGGEYYICTFRTEILGAERWSAGYFF